MAFLRSWMKELIETVSWSSFDTHEGVTTLTLTLPVRNPFGQTIVVDRFFSLLHDHHQGDVPVLSVSLNRTEIVSGDSEIGALVTIFTGSSLGTFFRRAFFGSDIHMTIDLSASTDITGSFSFKGFALNVDGHNYFQDVVQDIEIRPTFPVRSLSPTASLLQFVVGTDGMLLQFVE
jgi:hypothetical protein